MVERRDQVLITAFLVPLLMASTFLVRWPSTNGPFRIERAIAISLAPHAGAAARDDELGGALVGSRGETLGLLPPRRHRVRVALPRLSFSAAVRVIDRVHRQAAHGGPNAQPARLAGLAHANDLVIDVAQLPDGGAAADEHLAHGSARQPHLRVVALFGHQLPPAARG